MIPPPPPDAASSNRKNEPEGEDTELPSYSKIFGLVVPEGRMLAFALVLMLAAEASGLVVPIILADAYDFLVDPTLNTAERMDKINQVMIIVIVIHFSGMAAFFLRSAIMSAASERVVSRLRNNLYSSILKQEIAFFDDHQTGELTSRLGSDTTLIQQATSNAIPESIIGFAKLFTALGLMFWISPQLAGVTIGFVVIIFIISTPFGKALGSLSKRYQDALGAAQTHSTEALGAMRTVKSFAAEEREERRYRAKIGEPDAVPWWWPQDYKDCKTTYNVGFYKSIVNSGLMTTIFGLGFGSMYFSLWYGFRLVNDGNLTLGGLTAFQSYIFQIGASLGQTSRFFTQVIEARGASGRVFQLLERVPAIPKPDNRHSPQTDGGNSGDIELAEAPTARSEPLKPSSMEGFIEFKDVNFAYPSRPDINVLRDFSLTIPPNSTAALVGSSGAGKSTIVALLQRFYDIDGGSITLDGNDVRDLDIHWLRSNIGYVQQEPQLFGLTVRQNVCYGVDREVSDEEMEHACKEAFAHDFIMKWPNGYETLVGERGVKLSGGQKQRLAIARALVVDPKLLLLDEATSALDAESEHLVQEAIDNAMVGRTVVIVAHRLSTIKNADKIVVIDKHNIADAGTHNDLIKRCEKYQELIKRQSAVGMMPMT